MNSNSCIWVILFCGISGLSCHAVEKKNVMTYRHFNVIEKDGKITDTEPLPAGTVPLWAQDVSQIKWDWTKGPDPKMPWIAGPDVYVIPPKDGSGEPFYKHNHQPSITWLANGDLMAIWYSTEREQGTELTVLASRKRAGSKCWDSSSEFFKADNRNMHGSSLFYDGKGILYHFNGLGRIGAQGWDNLALLLRTSTDYGVTWTPARPVSSGAEYTNRHQVIAGMFQTQQGVLIQLCDASPESDGGTALHISKDGGQTWYDPGLNAPSPKFEQNAVGKGTFAGIHGGAVELKDGRLMALGRGDTINGCMPMSLSDDLGKTWTYSASPFHPIDIGQRLVLRRLNEGPILLISFTDPGTPASQGSNPGIQFSDVNGQKFTGSGMYAALSYDEGKTWPTRKLLTPGQGEYDGGGNTRAFIATPTRAEPRGYLAATQTPDGVIHLISSRLHYQFNLKWIQTPSPAVTDK